MEPAEVLNITNGALMPPRPQPGNWPGLRVSSANRHSPLSSVPAVTLTSRPVVTLISLAGSEPNNELIADIPNYRSGLAMGSLV